MHTGEAALTPRELHERLRGKQGIVVLLGDRLDPPAIDAGADLKVIANVAVGYDNLDVAYARSKGIVCTNTPDVLTDAVADYTWALDSRHHAAAGRGRAHRSARRVEGVGVRFHAGHEPAGQAAGDHRCGPDRTRSGRSRGGVRDARGSQQPAPGGLARCRGDVVRSPARHIRHRQPARAAEPGDAEAHRSAAPSRA